MADPSKYAPNYSFTGYQTANPSEPLPAPRLDTELANIATSVGTTVDAIKSIRRSDGALANQSVGPDQLSSALTIGFTNRGTWTSGVQYNAGDGVVYSGTFYSARVANLAATGNRPDGDAVTWQSLFTISAIAITDGSITQAKMDATYDSSLARLASPTFTGTPAGPTAAPGTNTTQLATTGFVTAAFTALANGVGAAYDTLAEIAADLVGRWNETVVHALSSKTVPVDADELPLLDSAGSFVGRKLTWANLKLGIAASNAQYLARSANNVALVPSNLAARPYFLVTRGGTSQTGVVANTHTLLTWPTEVYDNGGYFASNAWTPPAGPVSLYASALYPATNLTVGDQIELEIYKNGSLYQRGTTLVNSTSTGQSVAVEAFDVANGTDVYTVEIFMGASAGGGTRTVSGLVTDTYFKGLSIL